MIFQKKANSIREVFVGKKQEFLKTPDEVKKNILIVHNLTCHGRKTQTLIYPEGPQFLAKDEETKPRKAII